MSIRDEIIPYVDGNDLVAPNLVPRGTLKGSDNGPMYTAEYFIILKKSGQYIQQDALSFHFRIANCMSDDSGLLNRVPPPQQDGQEGPDDYYGVLNGCMQLKNDLLPRVLLAATVKYLGFLNNVNPSTKTLQSFLIRQPQLLACMIAAAFPTKRWLPLRIIFFPLFLISAIIIATSCINTPTSDTDSRRLSWHLWQCTAPVSLLCRLASKIWLKRLYKDYGPTGMQAVAKIYYKDNHPFQRYWITE
jgi:hypothetical protein